MAGWDGDGGSGPGRRLGVGLCNVSHARDRALLTRQPDLLAKAIAKGIVIFLEAHPREVLFGKDLLVQQGRFRVPQLP